MTVAGKQPISAAEDVAAEVRAWLGRRNISARRAAIQLGWSDFYIGRRLSAQVPFNVVDLIALADLLGVSVTVFFEPPEGFGTILSSSLGLAA